MSSINYLTTLSTSSYTAPGVRAAASTIYTVATGGEPQYTSNISLTLLSGSTITASSIGIGTSIPGSYPLNVNGQLNCTGLNVNSAPYVGSQWTTSTLTGTISSVYYIGNVGIKTAPHATYTLNVGGPLNCTGLNVNSAPYVGSQWTTSTTNVYYSGGSVGIGTATPVELLGVYGASNPAFGIHNSSTGYFQVGLASGAGAYSGSAAAGDSVIRSISGNLMLQYGAGNAAIYINSSNNVGIGTTSISYTLQVQGTIYASGDITAVSDRRYKTNVVALEDSLAKISQLQGVSYERTDEEDKSRKLGLLAQEVYKVYPEVVLYDEKHDKYSMNYTGLIAPLIESIKELKQIIEQQELRIQELEKRSL
jgi:hypothetical protein